MLPPAVVAHPPMRVRTLGRLTDEQVNSLAAQLMDPVNQNLRAIWKGQAPQPTTDLDWITAALAADRWDDVHPPGAFHVLNGLSMDQMRKVVRALTPTQRRHLLANIDRSAHDKPRMYLGIQQAEVGYRWWTETSNDVYWRMRKNPKEYADSMAAAFWTIDPLNDADRAYVLTFLHHADLDELYRHGNDPDIMPVPHRVDILTNIDSERSRRGQPAPTSAIPELRRLASAPPTPVVTIHGDHPDASRIAEALRRLGAKVVLRSELPNTEGADRARQALGVADATAPGITMRSGLEPVPPDIIGRFRERDGNLEYVLPAKGMTTDAELLAKTDRSAPTHEGDVITLRWAGEFSVIQNPKWWLGSGLPLYYHAGGMKVETDDIVRAMHWGRLLFGAHGYVVRRTPRSAKHFDVVPMTRPIASKEFATQHSSPAADARPAPAHPNFVRHDVGAVLILVFPDGQTLRPDTTSERRVEELARDVSAPAPTQVVTDTDFVQATRMLVGRHDDDGVRELIARMNHTAFRAMSVDDRRRYLRLLVNGGPDGHGALVEIVASSRGLPELDELFGPLRADGTLVRMFSRVDMPFLRLMHAIGKLVPHAEFTPDELVRFYFEFRFNPIKNPLKLLTAVWDWLKNFADAAKSIPEIPAALLEAGTHLVELGALIHRARGEYRSIPGEGLGVMTYIPGDADAQSKLDDLVSRATKALSTARAGFEYLNRLGAHGKDTDTRVIGEIGRGLRYALLIEAASNLIGNVGVAAAAGKAVGAAAIAKGGIKAIAGMAGVLKPGASALRAARTRQRLAVVELLATGVHPATSAAGKLQARARMVELLHYLDEEQRLRVTQLVHELRAEKVLDPTTLTGISPGDAQSFLDEAQTILEKVRRDGTRRGFSHAQVDDFIRQMSDDSALTLDRAETILADAERSRQEAGLPPRRRIVQSAATRSEPGAGASTAAPAPVTRTEASKIASATRPDPIDPEELAHADANVTRIRSELAGFDESMRVRGKIIANSMDILTGPEPPLPAALAGEINRLKKLPDPQASISAVDKILPAAISDEEMTVLLSWRRRWEASGEARLAREEIEYLELDRKDRRLELFYAMERAEEAREGVYGLLRRGGPNYAKYDVKFDEVMGDKEWLKIPAGVGLATDHVVSLKRISQMSELHPLLKLYQKASAPIRREIRVKMRDIGDLPSNLRRMRSDANAAKGDRSWHGITDVEFFARYKYSVNNVLAIRKVEDQALVKILEQIDKITKEFAEMVRVAGSR